jgi:hypothetical protein
MGYLLRRIDTYVAELDLCDEIGADVGYEKQVEDVIEDIARESPKNDAIGNDEEEGQDRAEDECSLPLSFPIPSRVHFV